MNALAQYDAACAALAAAVKADEVMAVHMSAKAIEAVARVAKNFDLEIDAVKLRVRAEARLGEMLIEAEAQGIICKHGGGRVMTSPRPARLQEIGVDRKLSMRAHRLGSIARPAIDEMLDRMEKESRDRGRVAIDVVVTETQKQKARYTRRSGKAKKKFPTALSGDARDWSVAYLRSVAKLLSAIADHCGPNDSKAVRDCITDEAIMRLWGRTK